jgi:outer membrane protein OmpA-like peptidoglycan-associated protein
MALKLSAKVKLWVKLGAAILLVLLLTLLLYCFQRLPSSPAYLDARLEDFLDEGFVIKEQMRLKVRDVRVGGESVLHLFRQPEAPPPSVLELLFKKKDSKPLVVNSPEDLRRLRQELDARQPTQLEVVLEDDGGSWSGRVLNGLARLLLKAEDYKAWRSSPVYIDVRQTSCIEVRRIVYEKIGAAVKERSQTREADREIDLDEVFNLLLEEKIDRYLETLNVAEEGGQCYKTVQLLKWIKGEEMEGFDSGEYQLAEPVQSALDPALDALSETRANRAWYDLKVKVVGYTDARPVSADFAERHALRKERTGINDWGLIDSPLTVFYRRCSDDRAGEPDYVPLDSGDGIRVKLTMTNNCELGAVRAYVAAVYMLNRLGRDRVAYSYATGGISPAVREGAGADVPKERKIGVKFVINSATVER